MWYCTSKWGKIIMFLPEAAITKSATKGMAVTAGTGAFAAVGSALKPMVIVGENEIGVRTRFGKGRKSGWLADRLGRTGAAYGTVGKGPRFSITHSIKKVGLQNRPEDLGLVLFRRDGEQFQADTSISWAVKGDEESLLKALFNIANLDVLGQEVRNISRPAISFILSKGDVEWFDQDALIEATHKRCGEQLDHYGVSLQRLYVEQPIETLGQMIRYSGNPNSIFAALPEKHSANGSGSHSIDVVS